MFSLILVLALIAATRAQLCVPDQTESFPFSETVTIGNGTVTSLLANTDVSWSNPYTTIYQRITPTYAVTGDSWSVTANPLTLDVSGSTSNLAFIGNSLLDNTEFRSYFLPCNNPTLLIGDTSSRTVSLSQSLTWMRVLGSVAADVPLDTNLKYINSQIIENFACSRQCSGSKCFLEFVAQQNYNFGRYVIDVVTPRSTDRTVYTPVTFTNTRYTVDNSGSDVQPLRADDHCRTYNDRGGSVPLPVSQGSILSTSNPGEWQLSIDANLVRIGNNMFTVEFDQDIPGTIQVGISYQPDIGVTGGTPPPPAQTSGTSVGTTGGDIVDDDDDDDETRGLLIAVLVIVVVTFVVALLAFFYYHSNKSAASGQTESPAAAQPINVTVNGTPAPQSKVQEMEVTDSPRVKKGKKK